MTMPVTEQFNLRIPGELARCVRIRAAEKGVRPRDVVVGLLEAEFGAQPIEPIAGQLTVEEASVPVPNGSPAGPAPPRPRAADKASAVPPGTTSLAGPAEGEPDVAPGGEASGCPECGGDVERGQCADCGWINVT